jgi:hypothetical protein
MVNIPHDTSRNKASVCLFVRPAYISASRLRTFHHTGTSVPFVLEMHCRRIHRRIRNGISAKISLQTLSLDSIKRKIGLLVLKEGVRIKFD